MVDLDKLEDNLKSSIRVAIIDTCQKHGLPDHKIEYSLKLNIETELVIQDTITQ